MKATISQGDKAFVLTLTPENDDEKAALPALARQMARGYMITPRGFDYMAPDVEFYAQPMPRGD